MLEHDLDAVVLRRVLALRQFAMFHDVDLGELATIGQNAVETELAPGTVVAAAGERLPAIHLVLDGCIATGSGRWTARDVFGSVHVFAGRRAASGATATVRTHTLRIESEDLGELLEDNFGVLVAAIREVSGAVAARARRIRMPPLDAIGPLGLVERLFLLRRELPFARAHVRALASLAQASEEQVWTPGTQIVAADEIASSAYVIVEGDVRSGGALLRPGDSIGWLETLAGHRHASALTAETATRALVSSSGALLDMLEDHTDLGLAMLATLSGEILDQQAA